MSVRASYHEAGDVESFDNVRSEMLIKDTAIEITRGMLLSYDATNNRCKVGAAGDRGPFYVARRTAAIGTDQVEAVGNDYSFYVATAAGGAPGVVDPFEYVKAGASGTVTTWVAGTDGEHLKVGKYIRLGSKPTLQPVATVSGDIILVQGKGA